LLRELKLGKKFSWQLYYMESTPKNVGEKTMSKEQVKVSPTGVGIEMGGQGGVYLLVLTGEKSKVD
jgi:hypothetical protein